MRTQLSTVSEEVPLGVLEHEGQRLCIVDLPAWAGGELKRWPWVLRLLVENVARTAFPEDRARSLAALRDWAHSSTSEAEIPVLPGRLLMHDTTSTPALVDVAAMRDTLAEHGRDPRVLTPRLPVEISVDHSLAVESHANPRAPERNMREEIRRNNERYRFLRWAARAMDTVHVNPPGTGIMHTINLEQLATVVTTEERDGRGWALPDLMIGTDSHTPMVNGLGVLGWGVGGLEAQTVMFGMPVMLRIPDVTGVRLTGALPPGVVATDLALAVTHRLRRLGVTGHFVEFFGPGVASLGVGERAVVANMAPEYGATTGFFPIDEQTLAYLRETGRDEKAVGLVRAYASRVGLWFDADQAPAYTQVVELDLGRLRPSAAGPRRPQDLRDLGEVPAVLRATTGHAGPSEGDEDAAPVRCPHGHDNHERLPRRPLGHDDHEGLPHHPVALAAITSCTNTSEPRLLIAAALLARKARARGLTPAPWVKTSLAPGSPAATAFLGRGGHDQDLSALGFDIVGFGCTTCIGNSGPLPPVVQERLGSSHPVAVLSGNRNFPGRVHPDLDLGLLVSPPLVVAYAIAGDALRDLTREPVGHTPDGRPVHLDELWPSVEEVDASARQALSADDFATSFQQASKNPLWHLIEAPAGDRYPWEDGSTILRRPPFASAEEGPLLGDYTAYPLLVLGDDVTTDHISPASAIPADSAVADFLVARGEDRADLNVYASRRGNWEVMARGAFQNGSLGNHLADGAAGGLTVHAPSGQLLTVWEAAERYRADDEPVVVIGGERYGMGSSRDWAAKAQRLLGVRAVLAASFERIHRSNLIGMGILPLITPGEQRSRLQALAPGDRVRVQAVAERLGPGAGVEVDILGVDGMTVSFWTRAAIETSLEVELLRQGGVIPAILREHLAAG